MEAMFQFQDEMWVPWSVSLLGFNRGWTLTGTESYDNHEEGLVLTAFFFFAGDERGLCKWDPSDEYDPHRRARIHAVHPHRGERAQFSHPWLGCSSVGKLFF